MGKYPVLTYLVLVFTLASPILAANRLNIPFELLIIYASWTPNLAAFIVLGLVLREKEGIRRLISGWGKWKVAGKWYLVALSPAVVASLAFAIYLILGGKISPPVQLVASEIILLFVFAIVTGATGEELGWRGFLLPRLQTRFNAFIATILVGIVWVVWHLPLWLIPGSVWQENIPYTAFAIVTISASFLYTWAVNRTNGSMLIASIIHFTMNLVPNLLVLTGLIPIRDLYILSAILYTAYAAIIIIATRSSWGQLRVPPKSEPVPGGILE